MVFLCVSFWPCTVSALFIILNPFQDSAETLQVCAVFLIYWSPQLKQMDYQQLMLFMQKLPTGRWQNQEIEPSQHWWLWFPKSSRAQKCGSWKVRYIVLYSDVYRLLQSLVGLNLVMRCHDMCCHANHAMPDFTVQLRKLSWLRPSSWRACFILLPIIWIQDNPGIPRSKKLSSHKSTGSTGIRCISILDVPFCCFSTLQCVS